MDRVLLLNDDKERVMLLDIPNFLHLLELAEKFATTNNTRDLASFKNKLREIKDFFQ